MTDLSSTTVWTVIILTAVLGFLLRAPFILMAERMAQLPAGFQQFLQMIPPAAFAALVAPAVLRPGAAWSGLSPEVLAATLAALVAWRTRSITWTILSGMAAVMLFNLLPFLA
ncbi:AzlD domain-containing protein [Ornithinimicrobium avium]|uniref:AzlD domain-containing protein n=1 Tax=Ornithinimicrobium avium TaxID=2283195 RepID=A0A345NNR1_9MICO|nr:AzlD domain-containing protein [Ornithinimicrobium avium]AXH96669.1 AzlD domain-containing protein [Ornithinimicrobium avium]